MLKSAFKAGYRQCRWTNGHLECAMSKATQNTSRYTTQGFEHPNEQSREVVKKRIEGRVTTS